MDDLYSALIEGVPTQPERQAALAAALRRQNILGQLGAASGDRVMAPEGQRLASQALTGSHDLAADREKQQAQDIQRAWHDEEAQHQRDQLAQQMTIAKMTDARQRQLAELMAQNRLDVQGEKNSGAKGKPKNLPASTIKELESYRDSIDDLDNAFGTYKPGYGGFGRNAENFLAQKGFGTQGMKDAQNWWANYGRQFTLDEMHRRFGARLTPQEMARFEQYHIDPNMTDDQIRQNLAQLKEQFGNMFSRRVGDLQAGGYDPGFLEQIGTGKPHTSAVSAPGDKYLGAARAQTQQPTSILQQALKSQPQVPLMNPQANLLSGLLSGQ